MYNPAIQVQVLTNADLGSYYFENKNQCRGFPYCIPLKKIKVFGWKLATNTLGVKATRCKRNMDIIPTCSICGRDPETAHQAMVSCTKAIALKHQLRNSWDLPAENLFNDAGSDWALLLLNQVTHDMRSKLLFMWWRT